MANIVKLTPPRMQRWAEAAAYLRELADRIDAGNISEIVVVFNDAEDSCFASWGEFQDRWRLYGALEYAKANIGG